MCNRKSVNARIAMVERGINFSSRWVRSYGYVTASMAECMVKGVGHLGNDEAMEAGGREFDPRPEHYSRMSF